jgi:hypothetical protein
VYETIKAEELAKQTPPLKTPPPISTPNAIGAAIESSIEKDLNNLTATAASTKSSNMEKANSIRETLEQVIGHVAPTKLPSPGIFTDATKNTIRLTFYDGTGVDLSIGDCIEFNTKDGNRKIDGKQTGKIHEFADDGAGGVSSLSCRVWNESEKQWKGLPGKRGRVGNPYYIIPIEHGNTYNVDWITIQKLDTCPDTLSTGPSSSATSTPSPAAQSTSRFRHSRKDSRFAGITNRQASSSALSTAAAITNLSSSSAPSTATAATTQSLLPTSPTAAGIQPSLRVSSANPILVKPKSIPVPIEPISEFCRVAKREFCYPKQSV